MLLMLNNGRNSNELSLSSKERYLAIHTLQRKGLVDAVFEYDKIADVKLSYLGEAYIDTYPRLENPFDWGKIASFSAVISVIIALLSIFISCY